MTSGWAEQTEVMPARSPRGVAVRQVGEDVAVMGLGPRGRRRARPGWRCPPSGPCGRRRGRRRRWRGGAPRAGGRSRSQQVTKVAAKVSPAPVGSTSSTAKAGHGQRCRRRRGSVAPSAPFLTTTARMPRARSSRAAAGSSVAWVKRKSSGPLGRKRSVSGEDALQRLAHAGRGEDLLAEVRVEGDGAAAGLDAGGGGEDEVDDRRASTARSP